MKMPSPCPSALEELFNAEEARFRGVQGHQATRDAAVDHLPGGLRVGIGIELRQRGHVAHAAAVFGEDSAHQHDAPRSGSQARAAEHGGRIRGRAEDQQVNLPLLAGEAGKQFVQWRQLGRGGAEVSEAPRAVDVRGFRRAVGRRRVGSCKEFGPHTELVLEECAVAGDQLRPHVAAGGHNAVDRRRGQMMQEDEGESVVDAHVR